MKGKEAGQTYLQGVLGKITDPDLKAAAERVFADATVQVEIGNGVVGQSEIDRQLQTLNGQKEELTARATELDQREQGLTSWHGKLDTWADKNKEFIRLGKAAKDAGITDPAQIGTNTPGATPAGMVTEEKLKETLQNELGSVLSFAVDQSALSLQHFERFGRPLDITPLIKHPKIREVGLQGVYELVHKEALEAHDTKVKTEAEEKIRADERQKVQAANVQMPYPSPTGSGSGSPLDALTTKGNAPLVDAAVAEYNRLQTTRTN